jgi:hypothetical protein
MGDLDRISIIRAMHQISDENGILNLGTVIPGRYYYILYSRSGTYLAHQYHELSYTAKG